MNCPQRLVRSRSIPEQINVSNDSGYFENFASPSTSSSSTRPSEELQFSLYVYAKRRRQE